MTLLAMLRMMKLGGDTEQWGIGGFEQFCDFLGQIDSYGAPSDTAAATDASAGIELIEPGRQFVGQPLAVARLDRVAGWGPRGVGKVRVEARVPAALAEGCIVEQVVRFIDARAEACRADHGAVGA